MVAVRMMQVAVNEIIGVVSVRHGLVAAARPVDVIGSMFAAIMRRRAVIGVLCVDGKNVLVDMAVVRMVKVAVVQIIGMAFVLDSDMAAVCAMLMGMALMNYVFVHRDTSIRPPKLPLSLVRLDFYTL